MIYELLCDTKLKRDFVDTRKSTKISIRVHIYESKWFKYGNGKELMIQIGDDAPDYNDIRYDIRYNNMSELEYVKAFVKEYAHLLLIFEISEILAIKMYE